MYVQVKMNLHTSISFVYIRIYIFIHMYLNVNLYIYLFQYIYIVLLRVEGMPIPGMALCIIGHTIACAIKTRESQVKNIYYRHIL